MDLWIKSRKTPSNQSWLIKQDTDWQLMQSQHLLQSIFRFRCRISWIPHMPGGRYARSVLPLIIYLFWVTRCNQTQGRLITGHARVSLLCKTTHLSRYSTENAFALRTQRKWNQNKKTWKCTWPTREICVWDPTQPIFHWLAFGFRLGGKANFRFGVRG